LVAQICPVAAAEDFAAPSSYSLIPVQLAMGRRVPVNAPPAKKPASAPVKTQGAITKEEDRRLTEAFNRMTPKERKRLAKAMKGLNPEERRQVAEAMKRQLAGQPTASPATKPGR
jgi:hypothetical protein